MLITKPNTVLGLKVEVARLTVAINFIWSCQALDGSDSCKNGLGRGGLKFIGSLGELSVIHITFFEPAAEILLSWYCHCPAFTLRLSSGSVIECSNYRSIDN